MNYKNAENCFKEARLLSDPKKDPQTWNLSNGLHNLTIAIELDNAVLRDELQQLRRQLALLQQSLPG
jgi:hypothetical protein